MTTKRTPRDRHRKASLRIDDAAVKLFARLEAVPLPRRMGYRYRELASSLAKMLGVHSEHFLDAHSLNDAFLCRRPPQYDFYVDSWERVLATRARLLQLAGLPPDVKGGPAYPNFDYDYAYAFVAADGDAHDFDDLDPALLRNARQAEESTS
jgi:hypothetical protein